MKDWEYNVTLILSIICLILAVWIIGVGRTNEKLQAKIQAQQVDIDRGNMSRQVGSRIIQDMIAVSASNHEIRAILETYGFVPSTVQSFSGSKQEKLFFPKSQTKGKDLKSTAGK
ncbi:MAG: hypothetical protein PHR77_14750 [Kiritimatiellae bacterium]|nr:hypothetical protein [Kiritimatiellia bacterium]MDD5520684.1 hypothetical protein [Kiritimatiellia bacterium]